MTYITNYVWFHWHYLCEMARVLESFVGSRLPVVCLLSMQSQLVSRSRRYLAWYRNPKNIFYWWWWSFFCLATYNLCVTLALNICRRSPTNFWQTTAKSWLMRTLVATYQTMYQKYTKPYIKHIPKIYWNMFKYTQTYIQIFPNLFNLIKFGLIRIFLSVFKLVLAWFSVCCDHSCFFSLCRRLLKFFRFFMTDFNLRKLFS